MEHLSTYLITITGLVQGVGFRPFVYRLARKYALTGLVRNTNENVLINLRADTFQLESFIHDLWEEAPPAASIRSLEWEKVADAEYPSFSIISSEDVSDRITEVSPDIAVCPGCLNDMKEQPHRIGYPFINCTNCGPRFTIVMDLPYDRSRSTMNVFPMCHRCEAEYHDSDDRRFHAQPVACNFCGPQYEYYTGGKVLTELEDILDMVSAGIDEGNIIAIKGMGGFHLACDALNEASVARLRASKRRESKPFAVMFRDAEAVAEFTMIRDRERELLNSWRRPIVILAEKKTLARSVSQGFRTIGAILPYMPLHYLLFEKLKTPVIVLTSGNLAEEPIIIDNNEALQILGPVTDGILAYNRKIHNRTDDSVAMVTGDSPMILRRSRGYVPVPVIVNLDADGIFACGAELVNSFCLGRGRQAIMSQHIGDLKNFETYDFYRESASRFMRLFRVSPSLVVHDLHPDYLSTRYARSLDKPVLAVQHHHAHIASVLAEHRMEEKVIGVSFDGTGYGTDGHTWGSEFMICDLAGFERKNHFRYMPMPGGDLVTAEPWRMALSYLYNIYGIGMESLDLEMLQVVDRKKVRHVTEMLQKSINSPLSSGSGRLFDAVSALLNICPVAGFHAEAPMRLENVIEAGEKGFYEFLEGTEIDFEPMFRKIIAEMNAGISVSIISARFHNTIVRVILSTAVALRDETGIRSIVLSGGTFQNRYLLSETIAGLEQAGFLVYTNAAVPVNDGGIALGQLAVAARIKSVAC